LQHWNFGDAQPQQSWRAFTCPAPGIPPHTSPSGLQLWGLRQRPTGGLVLVSSTHVMFPEPGPPTGPPQQSVSLLQMSPITRQPEATWQMCPPVLVGMQRRLQQLVPPVHAWPSTRHCPAPVDATALHVPAVAPLATVQRPVQQSAPLKQRSPSEAQVAPDDEHRPPWQLPEQQPESAVQELPSVPHPPPASAAHFPPVQVLLQQSEAPAQA
jgi:hypothetical protein